MRNYHNGRCVGFYGFMTTEEINTFIKGEYEDEIPPEKFWDWIHGKNNEFTHGFQRLDVSYDDFDLNVIIANSLISIHIIKSSPSFWVIINLYASFTFDVTLPHLPS